MSKNKVVTMLVLLAGITASSTSHAQINPIPSIGFKLGDDVATVKASLKSSLDPEPMQRNPLLPATMVDINKGKTLLHLRTKGIWAFFAPNGTVETIRLDAPFSGDVLGIRLGDDTKKLTEKLGKPITKPFPVFGTMSSYEYAIDDSAYVAFDVNDDGVQYIFIRK